MRHFLNWLIKNKTWLFSGIGISVLTPVLTLLWGNLDFLSRHPVEPPNVVLHVVPAPNVATPPPNVVPAPNVATPPPNVVTPSPNVVRPQRYYVDSDGKRLLIIDFGELPQVFNISNLRERNVRGEGEVGNDIDIDFHKIVGRRLESNIYFDVNVKIDRQSTKHLYQRLYLINGIVSIDGGTVLDKDNLQCGRARIRIQLKYDRWQVGVPGIGSIQYHAPKCDAKLILFRSVL